MQKLGTCSGVGLGARLGADLGGLLGQAWGQAQGLAQPGTQEHTKHKPNPQSNTVRLMSPDPAPPRQARFKAVDQVTGGSARPRP